MADPVRMSSLRSAARTLKSHLGKADANGDSRLSTTELRRYGQAQNDGFAVGQAMLTMHRWALRDLERASTATVAHVRSKVDEAIQVIDKRDANDNGRIDTGKELNSAKRLKTFQALSNLLEAGDAPSLTATLEAIGRANIPDLNDYGRTFDLSTYDATHSIQEVLVKVAGWSLGDYEVDDFFERSTGANVVEGFAASLEQEGADVSENAETEQQAATIRAAYDGVAAAIRAELGNGGYKRIESATHGIAEDGDTEFDVLLAQRQDNSWVAITSQNFPF